MRSVTRFFFLSSSSDDGDFYLFLLLSVLPLSPLIPEREDKIYAVDILCGKWMMIKKILWWTDYQEDGGLSAVFVLWEHNKLNEWQEHPWKRVGGLIDFSSTNLNGTHNWRAQTPVAHRKQTSDTLPSIRRWPLCTRLAEARRWYPMFA